MIHPFSRPLLVPAGGSSPGLAIGDALGWWTARLELLLAVPGGALALAPPGVVAR